MMSHNSKLQNLLYSQSQHDDEISLSKNLGEVRQNYDNLISDDYDDEGEERQSCENEKSHDFGTGESRYEQNDDRKDWKMKQDAKIIFRDVVGMSQQFQKSMSFNQSRFDSSINTDAITYKNLLHQKKKQEQKVNEVLDRELEDLQESLIKEKDLNRILKNRINSLENELMDVKSDKKLLESSIAEYHVNLQRKDVLFNKLRDEYQGGVEEMDQKSLRYEQTIRSMQKQINKLQNALKIYNDKDIGLTDFRDFSNTRRESVKSVYSTTSNEFVMEIQKLKLEKKNMETQFQYAKQDLQRKEEKMKNLQEDFRRKLALKQKQIKQLKENYEEQLTENKKLKKLSQTNTITLKQKLNKQQKEMLIKEQRFGEMETKLKYSMQEIKKKQEKIKQLLIEISDKNKKIHEYKQELTQEQGRYQIESKLQKDRENQINELEQQVKELKTQKFNLKRELESLEKPSNTQAKYKKEIEILKKQKSECTKQNGELLLEIETLQKQNQDMKNKYNGLKKKNQDLSKKKLKSEESKNQQATLILQQNEQLKQIISKITKENLELKKKAETNQQMANKLFILQSRLRSNHEESMDHSLEENEYDLQEINTALSEQLENREHEISSMRQSHQREIYRLSKEIQTLQKTISTLDQQILFKEKSLDFMHQKFVEIEKENTSLKSSKNILHSSFYEEGEEQQQAYKYYENRIADLQDKNRKLEDALREKQHMIKKANSGKQGFTFEIQQLKQRIKEFQSMVIANDSSKKFVPQSLSPQETIDFLMKMLKRVCKSQDILRSLVRIPEFRTITQGLFKTINKGYQ